MAISDVFKAAKKSAEYAGKTLAESGTEVASNFVNRNNPKYSGGGGGGSGSGRSTVSSGGGGNASPAPAINDEELAQKYGFTKGIMDAYPELARLFNQAVAGQWTPDRFSASLKNTQWYQSMSETQRKMTTLQFTDPKTYQSMWSAAYDHVQSLAGSMGANPDDPSMISPVAWKVFLEGWTDEKARNELGQHIVFGTNGIAHGEAGRVQQQIASYSYSMGVKNGDDWMRDRIMKVMSGHMTDQDMKSEVLNQAIAQFPGYEKQLRGGMTMQEVAQPYMQSMSQILEINPGVVNLFDPTISNALSYRDPSGSGASKPLWQFQNDLRQDDRWKKTQNAQDTAMSVTKSILQTFGEVKF